ncbi:MAG: EpsG family protein [Faecousia sp.]
MLKILPTVLCGLLLAFLSDSQSRYMLDDYGRKCYIRKEKLFYFIMTVSFAVFVGLRTRGNDTYVYRQMYENIGDDLSYIADIDWRKVSAAPGLQCYCTLLKSLGASTQDYFMVTALITIGIYLWFIRKYTCNIFLSIFYFVTMGVYGFTMAAIKQTMAVAFLVLATDNAIQRHWLKYLFWVAIAGLFHPYAFIYLVVPFVTFRPWSNSTYFLLAGSVLIALFMSRFLSAIDVVTDALGYNYTENSFSGEGVNIFRVLVVWVPLVLSFLRKEHLQHSNNRAMNMIVNLMMVNAVIMFVGLFGTANYFARLANYFLIFQTLALPWILGLFGRNDYKALKGMSIICFSAYYFYSAGIVHGGIDANYSFMTLWEYLKR